MADRCDDIAYAEMVRRQAAEDVARWRAQMPRPVWETRGTAGSNGTGRWAVWHLVGVFDGQQQALAACKPSGRFTAAAAMIAPETPVDS